MAIVCKTSIFIWSLPKLELIERIARHNYATREALSPLANHTLTGSVAGVATLDRTGDFVDTPSSLDVQLWTLFAASLRPAPPLLTLYYPSYLPYHPGSTAAGAISALSGWWNSKAGALTPGAQLDEIIAGPSRPGLPKLGEPGVPRTAAGGEDVAKLQAQQEAAQAQSVKAQGYGAMLSEAVAGVSKAASGAASQATKNFDLAAQRGELIDSLEQGMSNLERNASQFSKNLKQQALKSAVKSKFSSYF